MNAVASIGLLAAALFWLSRTRLNPTGGSRWHQPSLLDWVETPAASRYSAPNDLLHARDNDEARQAIIKRAPPEVREQLLALEDISRRRAKVPNKYAGRGARDAKAARNALNLEQRDRIKPYRSDAAVYEEWRRLTS
jgi:hypothetical protein